MRRSSHFRCDVQSVMKREVALSSTTQLNRRLQESCLMRRSSRSFNRLSESKDAVRAAFYIPFMTKLYRQHSGFTLIELMMTLAVAAVLVGIAAPTFRDLSIRSQISGYTNELIATINYTRSEAVRRGLPISICPSDDDGGSCSGNWNDGWIVFTDPNGDGLFDSGEVVLKANDAVQTNYSIGTDDTFTAAISYRADGSAANSGVITICHEHSAVGARAILVTRLRPRVARDTNGDRIPNLDDNTNIASCDSPSGA